MDSGDHITINFQTIQPISTDGRTKYNPRDAEPNAGNIAFVQLKVKHAHFKHNKSCKQWWMGHNFVANCNTLCFEQNVQEVVV